MFLWVAKRFMAIIMPIPPQYWVRTDFPNCHCYIYVIFNIWYPVAISKWHFLVQMRALKIFVLNYSILCTHNFEHNRERIFFMWNTAGDIHHYIIKLYFYWKISIFMWHSAGHIQHKTTINNETRNYYFHAALSCQLLLLKRKQRKNINFLFFTSLFFLFFYIHCL